jgi:hypothetical protein
LSTMPYEIRVSFRGLVLGRPIAVGKVSDAAPVMPLGNAMEILRKAE